jgi:hypothetical protein
MTFKRRRKLLFSGSLAQLVEQRTFNPFVVGSTPARPTKVILKTSLSRDGEVFFDFQNNRQPLDKVLK